jgi:hypothetical protein
MFVVHIKRKRGRVMLGSWPTFAEASATALAWWCKQTEQGTPEDLKGTWLESYDHDKDMRLWFYIPELATLEAMNWDMPGCEIRSVA